MAELILFKELRAKAKASNKCATVGGRKVFPFGSELYYVDSGDIVVAMGF
jgi:hypothetical protein